MTKRTPINQGVALDERETRGLSQAQMADVLGLEGPTAEQIVLDLETGFRKPKGSTLRIYESLNRGRWAGSHLLEMPAWSVDVNGPPVIHHNEWPRFVGRAIEPELHPQQWQFKKAGMPAFALDERTGFRQLVVAWIDHVPEDFDAEDILTEGVRRLEKVLLEAKR